MSMTTSVYGIAPPDDTWKKMKQVYDACDAAGIDPPEKVEKFFDFRRPDPLGVILEES